MVRLEAHYDVRPCGGRSLIDHPPIFSSDQSLLFVISGQNILIYNVMTSELVKTLKSEECSCIVGMGFPSNDDRTLIVCDKVGKLMTWKWHASVLGSEKTLKLPVNSAVQTFKLINNEEALLSWFIGAHIHVGIVNLESGDIVRTPVVSRVKNATNWSMALEFYDERPIVAFTNGPFSVYIFDAVDTSKSISHKISSDLKISSLAWHPTEELLAVGDSLGRVMLWRNPTKSSKPPRETCHWHHLPLNSIIFTPRGGLMLTGGIERVVVAWGSNNSRKFLPRFPDKIVHMASSYTHVAVCTADNGIQIVESGSFNVVGCIRDAGGLGGAKPTTGGHGPALQYARSSSTLLLPAGSGHLHLFSTINNSLLYTMDITNTNIVHPERDNLEPEQIEIYKMSVGCRSQWLVTWEGREEQERIRWWEWNGTEWRLHTIAACPHSPARSIDLHMAEDTTVTVTADQDNILRFWRLFDTTPGHDKPAWRTNAKSSRNSGEAGGVALTTDGSVAAAWYDCRLTLWDTTEGVQRASLAHPALRPRGRLVRFGRDRHMHLLACTTDTCLAIWNVLTYRLTSIVRLDTNCLISDPFSTRMAAITKQNDVIVFEMNAKEPLLQLNNALPPEQGSITSAAFGLSSESGQTDFKLYLLREQQEIFVVERSDLAIDSGPALETVSSIVQPRMTAYSAMIAEKQVNLVEKYHSTHRSQTSTKGVINELLSTPSHTQPRLSTLCRGILCTVAGTFNAKPDSVVVADVNPIASTDDVEQSFKVKRDNKQSVDWESMDWVKQLCR